MGRLAKRRDIFGFVLMLVILYIIWALFAPHEHPMDAPIARKRELKPSSGDVGRADGDPIAAYYASAPSIKCEKGQGKTYTQDQVFTHNSNDDLWLIINGFVMNVTSFIPHHPGGEMILKGAGVDASEMFSHHHPPPVVSTVDNFCIGRLA